MQKETHTMDIPSHVDVAVVGGGPAGLMAACMLRKNNVNAIVLDAAAGPNTASRATVLHSRSLEILEELDLIEHVMKMGNKLTNWDIKDKKTVFAELDFSKLDAKYPMIMVLPQYETERLLQEKLQELGGAVHRSARVNDLTDSGDKVTLEVSTPEAKTTVTASYVVASDGIKSTIRERLGIGFEGGEYNASFLTADCKFGSLGGLKPDALQLYLSTDGFALFIPEPNNIWRIVATVETAPKEQDVALYQEVVDARCPPGLKVEELVWYSRFHIHHRLAHKYRKGRVFLAGDAAHCHSPAGGQGMNIGIQDAYRLAAVISEAVNKGKTSARDLDRYEADRRPIAKGVVALTHNITTMAMLKSPILVMLRNWWISLVASLPFANYWITYKLSELEH